MIVSLRFANFACFRDPVEVSFVASADRTAPGNVMTVPVHTVRGPRDLRLLRALAVQGPNASGKSRLLDVLVATRDVFRAPPPPSGPGVSLPPFLLDRESAARPTAIELEFLLPAGGIDDARCQHPGPATAFERWIYGFESTLTDIRREWLYRFPAGRRTTVFERRAVAVGQYEASFGHDWRRDGRQYLRMTLPNDLMLRQAASQNNEVAKRVVAWLMDTVKSVSPDAGQPPYAFDEMAYTLDGCLRDTAYCGRVVEFLKRADLGIRDLRVRKGARKTASGPVRRAPRGGARLFPPRDEATEDEYFEILVDVAHGRPEELDAPWNWLSVWEESDGTRKLLALAGPVLQVLGEGMVLVADELDRSLHPRLLEAVLELFRGGPGRAQLMFSAHTLPQLLTDDFLRRDQILLTERDDDGSARVYALADVKETRRRPGENLGRAYLAGRFGGVPRLGRLLAGAGHGEE